VAGRSLAATSKPLYMVNRLSSVNRSMPISIELMSGRNLSEESMRAAHF
jgi:hypothetical protein